MFYAVKQVIHTVRIRIELIETNSAWILKNSPIQLTIKYRLVEGYL